MLGPMGSSFSGSRYLHNVISQVLSWTYFHSKLTATFSSVLSNKNKWQDSVVGLFNLPPALGMICVYKNVRLVMQHPLLGSLTEGPTDTSKVLVPMPRPGQEPSIYICLCPVKAADFMHPKWEGCIVINSLIFVVICRNIFYCLNLGKNYL